MRHIKESKLEDLIEAAGIDLATADRLRKANRKSAASGPGAPAPITRGHGAPAPTRVDFGEL